MREEEEGVKKWMQEKKMAKEREMNKEKSRRMRRGW